MSAELLGDSVAAENVRLLLAGEIVGEPLQGTLAWRVYMAIKLAEAVR